MKYRCSIPQCDGRDSSFNINKHNTTDSDSQTIFVRDSSGSLNFCKAYPINISTLHEEGRCTLSDFDMTGDPVDCNAQLTNIIFDELPMESTVVTEFNLFCNEEYKAKYSSLKHACNLAETLDRYRPIYE